MCESAAYILTHKGEELFLESVETLENREGTVRLVSMFGEEKTFRGKVKAFYLVDHKILLEPETGES